MASTTLRPGTLADSDAISHVHYKALNPYHEFYAAFLKTHPREIIAVADRRALQDPETVVVVAEEAGEIVGFVIYWITNANSNKSENDTEGRPLGSISAPKEHLRELWDRFNERNKEMNKCKEEAVKGQKYYEVLHLMVHPSHQRSGVGGRLLASVLSKADADAAPTVVVSSAEGHGLYIKHEFRSLGTWPVDNAYWAGEAARLDEGLGPGFVAACSGMKEVEDCMIRQPRFRSL